MNVGLVIAGSLSFLLAAGHTLVGPLVVGRLPPTLHATRFGDGGVTRRAIVFTHYALGLMLTATGAILIALAVGEPGDDGGNVVFLVGAVYAAAAALQVWMARRRPSGLMRRPVWVLMIAVSILCFLNT